MSTIDNISKFWWLKQYIEDCGYNVGHSLFSIGHLLWLIIIAFLSIYTLNYYKNASNTKKYY